MPTIPVENLNAARRLYKARIKVLMARMQQILDEGAFLGPAFEQEISLALSQIEDEVGLIEECLDILNYLQK